MKDITLLKAEIYDKLSEECSDKLAEYFIKTVNSLPENAPIESLLNLIDLIVEIYNLKLEVK